MYKILLLVYVFIALNACKTPEENREGPKNQPPREVEKGQGKKKIEPIVKTEEKEKKEEQKTEEIKSEIKPELGQTEVEKQRTAEIKVEEKKPEEIQPKESKKEIPKPGMFSRKRLARPIIKDFQEIEKYFSAKKEKLLKASEEEKVEIKKALFYTVVIIAKQNQKNPLLIEQMSEELIKFAESDREIKEKVKDNYVLILKKKPFEAKTYEKLNSKFCINYIIKNLDNIDSITIDSIKVNLFDYGFDPVYYDENLKTYNKFEYGDYKGNLFYVLVKANKLSADQALKLLKILFRDEKNTYGYNIPALYLDEKGSAGDSLGHFLY